MGQEDIALQSHGGLLWQDHAGQVAAASTTAAVPAAATIPTCDNLDSENEVYTEGGSIELALMEEFHPVSHLVSQASSAAGGPWRGD